MERQKKLDMYANEQFISALSSGGRHAPCFRGNEGLVHINSEISKNPKNVAIETHARWFENIDVTIQRNLFFRFLEIF